MTKYFYIRAESANTLDDKSKALLTRLVRAGKLDESVLAEEIHAHRGTPVACVAYEVTDYLVKYAVSTHYEGDEFNRTRAHEIAEIRLKDDPSITTTAQGSKCADVMSNILASVQKDKSLPQRTRKAAQQMLKLYTHTATKAAQPKPGIYFQVKG